MFLLVVINKDHGDSTVYIVCIHCIAFRDKHREIHDQAVFHFGCGAVAQIEITYFQNTDTFDLVQISFPTKRKCAFLV